jgi:hypothetical protein
LSFTRSRTTFSIIVAIAVSVLVVAAGIGVQGSTQVQSSTQTPSSGGVLYGQSYSGMLTGGYLWENNSFPFQSYAANSTILALPAISSWLTANGYSPSDLRPFLSMWPSSGNPYDFSQMTATENGTTYLIHQYVVTGSAEGLVIGAWVADNSSQTVTNVYTFSYISSVLLG